MEIIILEQWANLLASRERLQEFDDLAYSLGRVVKWPFPIFVMTVTAANRLIQIDL